MDTKNEKKGAFIGIFTLPKEILLIIISLSAISFWTSFDGFRSLTTAEGSIVVVLVLLVTMIQYLLLQALDYAFKTYYFMVKAIWYFIYFTVMFISVFFSYSFYYSWFRAEDFAKHNFNIQLSEVKEAFINFASEFDSVHSSVITLVKHSEDQAIRERKFGATCETHIGAGNGPRRAFRDDEAKTFGFYGPEITKLKVKINSDITQITQRIETYTENNAKQKLQGEINDIIAKVNRYRTDAIFARLIEDLENHTGKNRINFKFSHPVTGKEETISCKDNTFEQHAKATKRRLDGLDKINPVALFDPKDDRQRFSRTFLVFLEAIPIVTGYRDYDPADKKDGILKGDLSPIYIGIFVDMMIFLVMFATSWTYNDKDISENFEGRYHSVGSIKAAEEFIDSPAFANSIYGTLEKYHLQNLLFLKILAIPARKEGLSPIDKKLVDLFEIWTVTGRAKPFAFGIPHKSLHKRISSEFNDDFPFDLYRIPKVVWRDFIFAVYSYKMHP